LFTIEPFEKALKLTRRQVLRRGKLIGRLADERKIFKATESANEVALDRIELLSYSCAREEPFREGLAGLALPEMENECGVCWPERPEGNPELPWGEVSSVLGGSGHCDSPGKKMPWS